MNVSKLEHGVVVQTWRDVETTDEFRVKYGLYGAEYSATPEGVGPGHVVNDKGEYSIPAVKVTPEQITEERNRRITAGFKFEGHIFQADPESLANITGAATAAIGALVAGQSGEDVNWVDPKAPFVWLASDNTQVPMSPLTVVAFGNAAMAHKSRHIHAARVLKDMSPIPQSFAEDKYWGGA